jgi:hypothetical protein
MKLARPRTGGRAVSGTAMPQVFFAPLVERAVIEPGCNSLIACAWQAGARGFRLMEHPYARTDKVRQHYADGFVKEAKDPADVLVMLDNDHVHPPDIVGRLAAYPAEYGVVGGLNYRRGDDFRPNFYTRGPDGNLQVPAVLPMEGLLQCVFVGTGAIAIKRWVFDRLIEKGYRAPWFRYTYLDEEGKSLSEDYWFARICEEAGIAHYVDCGLLSPHIGWGYIGREGWENYVNENQEKFEASAQTDG